MEIIEIYFSILGALFVLSLIVLMLLNFITLSFSSSLKVPEDKNTSFYFNTIYFAVLEIIFFICFISYYIKGNKPVSAVFFGMFFFMYVAKFFQNLGFENVVQESLTTNEKNIVKSILKLNYVPFSILIIIVVSMIVAYITSKK